MPIPSPKKHSTTNRPAALVFVMLVYTKKITQIRIDLSQYDKIMVGGTGVEPVTSCESSTRSSQLS
jgi:hypothetical protein